MDVAWLDQMFEPCGVYRAVREDGVIVDFDRVFLNAAGRVLLLTLGGDESVTSMIAESPNVVEQGLFEHYVAVAETGIPWVGVSQSYTDDRRSIVVDVHVWRVPDGIAVTYRDVSERERLTAELRRSEQRFRQTVEQLPDVVSVFEAVREAGRIADFTWVYANDDTVAVSGFALDLLVGRRLLEVFPSLKDTGIVDVLAAVVETEEPWEDPRFRLEDTWGDGDRRAREFTVRAARVGDGIVVFARELTDETDPASGAPGQS